MCLACMPLQAQTAPPPPPPPQPTVAAPAPCVSSAVITPASTRTNASASRSQYTHSDLANLMRRLLPALGSTQRTGRTDLRGMAITMKTRWGSLLRGASRSCRRTSRACSSRPPTRKSPWPWCRRASWRRRLPQPPQARPPPPTPSSPTSINGKEARRRARTPPKLFPLENYLLPHEQAANNAAERRTRPRTRENATP